MSYADMEKQLANQRTATINNQSSQVNQSYQNQLAELEKNYQSAVNEGNISVRDANDQFETQKKQLEQDHYKNAQSTQLYGQNMHLQNSQQMEGLIQGEVARNNQLINTNVGQRDKRLNDIKDRLNTILQNKNADSANFLKQRDLSLQGIIAGADADYAKGMFGVNQMRTQFENQLRLQAQQASLANKQQTDNYQRDLWRELAKYGYTPDNLPKGQTPEATLQKAQISLANTQKNQDLVRQSAVTAQANSVLNNPYLSATAPTNYMASSPSFLGGVNPIGGLLNFLTGYDEKSQAYNTEHAKAVEARNRYLQQLGFDAN